MGWLFESVAGIRVSPLENRFEITPCPHPSLSWVACSYDSIIGEISVTWRLCGTALTIEIDVPMNVTASLSVADLQEMLSPGKHQFVVQYDVGGKI